MSSLELMLPLWLVIWDFIDTASTLSKSLGRIFMNMMSALPKLVILVHQPTSQWSWLNVEKVFIRRSLNVKSKRTIENYQLWHPLISFKILNRKMKPHLYETDIYPFITARILSESAWLWRMFREWGFVIFSDRHNLQLKSLRCGRDSD